jgi:hypothetical protein
VECRAQHGGAPLAVLAFLAFRAQAQAQGQSQRPRPRPRGQGQELKQSKTKANNQHRTQQHRLLTGTGHRTGPSSALCYSLLLYYLCYIP